jgi:DNA excision repair protein ERCC-2
MAEHPTEVQPLWLDFCFDALAITRLAESFGEHSLFDLVRSPQGDATLSLRNVVPASFLKPRLAAAHSTTLFSATLQPRRYYADLLGLPDDTAWIDVDSPFAARQLSVRIAGHISTRWQHRSASLAPVVALIARQYAQRAGNYLAFFSSFDYLERVVALFAQRHPEVPLWPQVRGMSEASARMPALARPAATPSSISPRAKSSTTTAASSAAPMRAAPMAAVHISVSMEKGLPLRASAMARRPKGTSATPVATRKSG